MELTYIKTDKGAALIAALMFLVVLTLLGLAAIMTSGTEIMISRNDRLNKLALDYANAGIQDALARIDLPDQPHNDLVLGNWTATAISANAQKNRTWTFSSNQYGMNLSFVNFAGSVKYRLEDYLHNYSSVGGKYNPSNPRVVGYSRDCKYQKSPIATVSGAFPVYQITATGAVLTGSETSATATVVVDVSRNTLNLNTPGGLYSNSCVDLKGSCMVSGGGATNAVVSSSIGCTSPDPTKMTGGGYSTTTEVNMTDGQFLGASLADLQQMATTNGTYYSSEASVPHNAVWGGYTDETDPKIVYINGDFHLTGQVMGYGILIVTGGLDVTGSIQWKGLVYVLGDLKMEGGGNVQNITGGIMANGAVQTDVGGNAKVTYDKNVLDGIARQSFMTKIINWQRIQN